MKQAVQAKRGLMLLAACLVVCAGCGGRAQATVLNEAAVPVTAPAPASVARVTDGSFWSPALGRHMPLAVYLPPTYDSSSSQRFPVLYMLHGLGGGHRDWQRLGLFDNATQLIERGEIPPMIIVTPAGESGYWVDHANGGPRFGSYISQDLVSYIDAAYRTIPNRMSRAIGGTSMGAHGALQLALNNPGQFGVVGAHSLVLRNKQQAFAYFGDQAYFERHDPVSIVSKNPERVRSLRLWVDIGKNDGWFNSTSAFHRLLQANSVQHTWREWDGGHDSSYCGSHVADYLRYYGEAFMSLEAISPAW